jgi:predicted DsbA family dithiol-disulfide isomerase
MYAGLRKSGKEYGIEFGDVTILANSRKAFEASEFAREQGKYDEFHGSLFYAYFTEVRNIGDEEVIMDVASKTGLDISALKKVLDSDKYLPMLQKTTSEARELGFSGVPAFVVGERYSIVGVQPIEVFREAIRKLQG